MSKLYLQLRCPLALPRRCCQTGLQQNIEDHCAWRNTCSLHVGLQSAAGTHLTLPCIALHDGAVRPLHARRTMSLCSGYLQQAHMMVSSLAAMEQTKCLRECLFPREADVMPQRTALGKMFMARISSSRASASRRRLARTKPLIRVV